MDFSKWRPNILHEMKYLVFHNYNVFFGKKNIFCFPVWSVFCIFVYFRRLLLSKWIMEKMSWKISLCKEWWHCWIINQMKNRNTSSKTENDIKLMNNYFTSIGEVRKHNTVDSRYLEFDGTMEKIWVNRSSTQEELRRYRKRGLFNNERETTRAKFWRAKTSIACPYSRNDFKHIRCFCCCFFSLR